MSSPIGSLISESSVSIKNSSITNLQKPGGRSWKELTKAVTRAAGYTVLASLAIISVASLIIGIVAMLNPVGLGLFGTSVAGLVAGGVAFAAENAFFVLMAGVIVGALAGIAALVVYIVKKCFPIDIDSSSKHSISQSGSSASVI